MAVVVVVMVVVGLVFFGVSSVCHSSGCGRDRGDISTSQLSWQRTIPLIGL